MAFAATIYCGYQFTVSVEQSERFSMATEATRDLLISMLNAETGQRGYLITGNPLYLAPYNAGSQMIGQRLDMLHHLIEGTTQSHEEEDIRRVANQKLAELQFTIDRYRSNPTSSLAEVNSHLGKSLMDDLRVHLDTVEVWAETRYLNSAQNAMFYARWSFLSGCVTMVLAIGSVIWEWGHTA